MTTLKLVYYFKGEEQTPFEATVGIDRLEMSTRTGRGRDRCIATRSSLPKFDSSRRTAELEFRNLFQTEAGLCTEGGTLADHRRQIYHARPAGEILIEGRRAGKPDKRMRVRMNG